MARINDNKFRPLEIVHDFGFVPCSLPQDTKLPDPKERIDHLKSLGYGGVVVNPSFSDYLSEESIKQTFELIKYAKQQGLLVWIYDEKYYPSGSAGGIVPNEHPEHEAKCVAVETVDIEPNGKECINSPHGYSSVMAAYVCELDENGNPVFDTLADISARKTFGGGVHYENKSEKTVRIYAFFGKTAFEFCCTSHNTRTIRRYIDTMNKNAVSAFLEKTYGGYNKYIDAIGELVEGFFTDEPQIPGLCRENYRENYREWAIENQTPVFRVYDKPDSKMEFTPYIPWTENIEEAFDSLHGYALMPSLPQLFFDESEKGEKIRADFWQTASELFRAAFGETYREYCEKQKVTYTGHFLHEEEFWKHPYMHGDMLKQLGEMHMPGCDFLVATPERIFKSATAVKFAASASDLYEREGCMAEVSNMARDINPMTEEAYKLAVSLETALGVTRFFSYYTDFCLTDEQLRRCCDFTANLTATLDGMTPVRNCYVYVPNCSFMAESYPAWNLDKRRDFGADTKEIEGFMTDISEALVRTGIDFNFINDDLLEKIADGKSIATFSGEKSVLVLPPHISLPEEMLKGFKKVIFAKDITSLCGELKTCGLSCVKTPDLITLHKQNNTTDAYLLVNISDDEITDTEIAYSNDISNKQISVYNPHCDTKAQISELKISVPAKQCRIVLVEAAEE